MAYSLRLPSALDASARERSDYLGISLNALLCVALDAYLRAPGDAPAVEVQSSGGVKGPSKTSRSEAAPVKQEGVSPTHPQGFTRAQRQQLKARLRAQRKAL